MKCVYCNRAIPFERRQALPGVETCVNCSDEPDRVGTMIVAHKTGSQFFMIDNVPENAERIRQLERANKRAR